MTVQEAEEKVKSCERELTQAHSELVRSAENAGRNAALEASKRVTRLTLEALIISLIGVLVAFSGHYFWGIVLVIVGGYIAYHVYTSANKKKEWIENFESEFERNFIDPNKKI